MANVTVKRLYQFYGLLMYFFFIYLCFHIYYGRWLWAGILVVAIVVIYKQMMKMKERYIDRKPAEKKPEPSTKIETKKRAIVKVEEVE
jgi:hypothetical protein